MLALISLTLSACTGFDPAPNSQPDSAETSASAEQSSTSSGQGTDRGLGKAPVPGELIGTWRPLALFGKDVHQVKRVNGDRLIVDITEQNTGLAWTAYDGCNWTSGRARLGPAGRFSASEHESTLRGCIGQKTLYQTNVKAIATAALVRRLGPSLVAFYDSAGRVLGEYRRTHPWR